MPRPQLRQEASLTPPWHPARAPRSHCARTFHGTHARHRESRSAHAAAAAAAATGQHRARARHPARRAHRTRSHSTAAGSSAAELQAPDTTHERRRTTTKRCCVPTRAQSRRRRSMGQAKTWCSPRQRGLVARAGGLLFPPMRAWLEQPHGRHHKAPPKPCALTTNRQTTALHSHRPLASGCRRGMQLQSNVVWDCASLLLALPRTLKVTLAFSVDHRDGETMGNSTDSTTQWTWGLPGRSPAIATAYSSPHANRRGVWLRGGNAEQQATAHPE